MSRRPTGWSDANLGEVCDSGQYGWTCKASHTGTVKFLRTTDITKGSINWASVPYCDEPPENVNKYQLHSGDIVISRAGSVGFSKLLQGVPHDAVFASYLIRFKPTSVVDPRYVAAYLNSSEYWSAIGAASSGIALANVNASKLATLNIPLAPLPEQKRIADKLDTVLARVDACRDRLDRLPTLLKRFRQSILAAATSGRLTEDWRSSCTTGLTTWIEIDMAAACLKITDGEHISPPLCDEGIPLVSAKDVREWGVDFSETKFVSRQFAEVSRKRCNPENDDVLVVSRGATVGRACLVSSSKTFCLMGSVLLFKPNTNVVSPQFFAYFLGSPSGLEQLTKASGATAQQAIYIRDVKTLPIPIPSLPEQHEIVRRVDTLFAFADRLEARLATARQQVEQLTPALLAKAFRGELVPQDPADEPASALLKRLAAQRESAPPAKGRRSKAPASA